MKNIQTTPNPFRTKTATYILRHSDDCIGVCYHETEIVRLSRQEVSPGSYVDNITLNSGGWRTVTTKRRMNEVSQLYSLGFSVYQRKGDWFVESEATGVVPFEDGIVICRSWRQELSFPFEEVARFITLSQARAAGVPLEHLWSVSEGEDDGDWRCWIYGPSHHFVNLLHFVQTKEKHDGKTYYEETWQVGKDFSTQDSSIDDVTESKRNHAFACNGAHHYA